MRRPRPGQLDQAATWLLENADNMAGLGRSRTDSGSSCHSAPLSGVEVKAESVCICLIDDCLDCDIPLAELTFSRKSHSHTSHDEGSEDAFPNNISRIIKIMEKCQTPCADEATHQL